MIGWIARVLLVFAGFITSFFVTRDSLHFSIIQMVVAVFLFTLVVAVAVFWPMLQNWFKQTKKS
jgi:hypothetical protein